MEGQPRRCGWRKRSCQHDGVGVHQLPPRHSIKACFMVRFDLICSFEQMSVLPNRMLLALSPKFTSAEASGRLTSARMTGDSIALADVLLQGLM
eukprot:3291896-Pleurochrysis_carterae.AAC.1